MSNPHAERATQERVIALFQHTLGYTYLGNWQHRQGNAPVEEDLLLAFLAEQGVSPAHAKAAVDRLRQETLTVQMLFAGNNSEGLRYGTIGTPAKHYLAWKEDEDTSLPLLEKYLCKFCHKTRIIELLHDFVIFDGGQTGEQENQYSFG